MFRTLAIKFWNWLFPVPLNSYSYLWFEPNLVYNTKENTMARAQIVKLAGGKFGLATSEGIIGTYSRRRDAVRGADRRSLVVVNG